MFLSIKFKPKSWQPKSMEDEPMTSERELCIVDFLPNYLLWLNIFWDFSDFTSFLCIHAIFQYEGNSIKKRLYYLVINGISRLGVKVMPLEKCCPEFGTGMDFKSLVKTGKIGSKNRFHLDAGLFDNYPILYDRYSIDGYRPSTVLRLIETIEWVLPSIPYTVCSVSVTHSLRLGIFHLALYDNC